jgi:hypothetical protein
VPVNGGRPQAIGVAPPLVREKSSQSSGTRTAPRTQTTSGHSSTGTSSHSSSGGGSHSSSGGSHR